MTCARGRDLPLMPLQRGQSMLLQAMDLTWRVSRPVPGFCAQAHRLPMQVQSAVLAQDPMIDVATRCRWFAEGYFAALHGMSPGMDEKRPVIFYVSITGPWVLFARRYAPRLRQSPSAAVLERGAQACQGSWLVGHRRQGGRIEMGNRACVLEGTDALDTLLAANA